MAGLIYIAIPRISFWSSDKYLHFMPFVPHQHDYICISSYRKSILLRHLPIVVVSTAIQPPAAAALRARAL